MEAPASRGAPLYDNREVVWLVGYWTAIWVVANFTAWPLWRCWLWLTGAASGRSPPGPLEKYRRRLCRAQVYCFLSTVGGVHLLSLCGWNGHDLLYNFSVEHQVLFTMAIGHWLTTIWEDAGSTSFLKGGLTNPGEVDLGNIIWVLYLIHHIVAMSAFASALYLRCCTGLAAFGLVFELPILLLNHREFATFADKPPAWFQDGRRVETFWNRLQFLFKVGRYGPAYVYLYSICFWWDDLDRLNYQESTVYHTFGLFFTFLNWALSNTLLVWWRTKDIKSTRCADEVAAEEEALRAQEDALKEELQELGESQKKQSDSAVCVELEEPPKTLQHIEEAHFKANMGPLNAEGKVFLEIDGVAYDVTDFLQKHPGGESVLRDYAGRDASEAFKEARHSMNARIMMQKYCVGAITKPETAYRIYEHPDQLQRVWWEGVRMACGFLPVAVLLPRTAPSDFARLATSPQASLLEMLVPGLMLGMWAGWSFTLILLISGSLKTRLTRGALLTTAGLGMMLCGFALGRMPVEAGLPPAAPTGVEIGIVLVLLFEDFVEFCTVGSRHWSLRMLTGPAAVGAGFFLRGLPELLLATRVPGLSGLLFASGLCLMVRQIDDTRCAEQVKDDTLQGVALLGPTAGTAMIFLYCSNPAVEAAVLEFVGRSWFWIGTIQADAMSVLLGTMFVTNSTYMCSPAWSARAIALIFGSGCGFAGGIFGWRWLSWVAWLYHLGVLGARQASRIDEAARAGRFAEVPEYQVGTRALFDLTRTGMGTWAWMTVLKPVREICNFILPEELAMYGSPIPVFDLGDDVDLGVAAYYAPEAVLKSHRPESQLPPEYFVCNVGHVDMRAQGGMPDLQKTMNTLRDTWAEFRGPHAKGLVANMVCFFPRVQGTTFAKEINLSCWHSPEDAQEWYARSPAHGDIMRQHSNGQLKTFGNLLASLVPHGKIRHQDRCSSCARLVESDTVGEKAPRRCRTCGGRGFGYPWF